MRNGFKTILLNYSVETAFPRQWYSPHKVFKTSTSSPGAALVAESDSAVSCKVERTCARFLTVYLANKGALQSEVLLISNVAK